MIIDFPVHFNIFALNISAHMVFELLAFFIGYRYYLYLRKGYNDEISSINRLFIIIGAGFGALLGSRLIGTLEDPVQFLNAENKLLYFYISKTITGGLLFGTWGVEAAKKIIKVKTSSGDLFTYPIILAMMIGRVGCFLNGVYEPVFGVETSCIFGMNMGDGLKRHPIALYEIVFLGILWFVLKLIQRNFVLKSGDLFKFFMLSYFAFRFFIEFIKPVYIYPFIGLSAIQITSILCFVYYGILFVVNKRKSQR